MYRIPALEWVTNTLSRHKVVIKHGADEERNLNKRRGRERSIKMDAPSEIWTGGAWMV